MLIAPGTLVRLKNDPARGGRLLEGQTKLGGAKMVRVQYLDGTVRSVPYSNLEPVPSEPESPWDLFAKGRFVDPDFLRRTLTRLRVTGGLSDVVYSMEATKTDFYAYQFKPVIKLINSPTDALLIADEVGLGKTIEAGLVWTELRARLECDRLLVVCPKTLCQKWKDELSHRFGVEAQIADARELLGTLRRSRRLGGHFALVCSMQGLRPPSGWDDDDPGDDSGRGTARRDLARFLEDVSGEEPLIDLLVIDEAHHMRNPETLLNCFGRLASSASSHRLYLSATPIHLRNRDLHSLLTMVDPDTFEFESTLNDLIATNEPIVAARDLLLSRHGTVSEIRERLDEAEDHEILRTSEALAQIRAELTDTDLDHGKRSELAARLERVNQLSNYVTRTRRRDVQEFRVIREPKAPVLEMSADERLFYDEISYVVSEYARLRGTNEFFLLSMPQRLLTSSLAASSAYWSRLPGAYDEDIEESDDDLLHRSCDYGPLVSRIADRACDLAMTERLAKVDTKFQLLVQELRHLWKVERGSKVIVFSSFKPTLRYLEKRLTEEEIGVELLHGSTKRPRADILKRFKEIDHIWVLLSSEVGSEGIDLQFSSIVVNYDLPWNPMRLEQRIGRVDRLGQERRKVTVLNLIYNDTIDKRIYDRLYERLGIGRRALGEMEAVLGTQIREMTIKLLDPNLSDHHKTQVIDQTAQALEGRRREEEQLEAEAGSLVQHGDYILARITESRDRHRWLSGDDILIYVRDRVRRDFPGSAIESSPAGSDTYRIDLSLDAAKALQAYLLERGLRGQTRLPYPGARQRFRFTSSIVQRDSQVEYVSQLHPLVRFAADRDLRDDTVRNAQAVSARVSRGMVPVECGMGLYVLAARLWSSGRAAVGTLAHVRVGYSGANVSTGELISAGLAEQLFAAAAEHGRPIPNAAEDDQLSEASTVLSDAVESDLDHRFNEFVTQALAETKDRVAIKMRALVRHFETKIADYTKRKWKLEQLAATHEAAGDARRAGRLKSLVAGHEGSIKKFRRALQLRESEIEGQRDLMPEWTEVGCLFLQVDE